MSSNPPIQLEAPGKGLPWFDGFMARWVVFPLNIMFNSPQKATLTVETVGRECLEIAHSLSEKQLQRQVLVPKIRGIEDSSRFWSVLMTIEHLTITGAAMLGIAESLAEGHHIAVEVRIEDVKPHQNLSTAHILHHYEEFLNTYVDRMTYILETDTHMVRHRHPWFWNLSASQWLVLNGMHHLLHLKQIKLIQKQLV